MKQHNIFTIKDLSGSEEFREFFVILREVTGIVIALTYPDGSRAELLCGEEEFSPVCRQILSTTQGRECCYSTNIENCNLAAGQMHGIRYSCHAGLIDFVVPIYVENQLIGHINGGQILPDQHSDHNFEQIWSKVKHLAIDKDRLREAYNHSPYMETSKLKALLKLMEFFANYFCEMGRRLHTAYTNQDPLTIQAIDFIRKNFKDDISMRDVAENVGFSKWYFSRSFGKAVGMNFTQFLSSMRISEAKKLLTKTDWSITKIAFEVGFNDLSCFNRSFRKFENCTPGQYRKKYNCLHQKMI